LISKVIRIAYKLSCRFIAALVYISVSREIINIYSFFVIGTIIATNILLTFYFVGFNIFGFNL